LSGVTVSSCKYPFLSTVLDLGIGTQVTVRRMPRNGSVEPPIRVGLIDAALWELVISAEVREPAATVHPVSAKATNRMIAYYRG
jgi:hypothetical protein